MFGVTRAHEDVTLFQTGGISTPGPFDTVQEDYRVGAALFGVHTLTDTFLEARVEFDWLGPWLCPPGLVDDNDGATISVQWGWRDLAAATIDDDPVSVRYGGRGTAGTHQVNVERCAHFRVTFATPRSHRNIVEGRIRPIQDLLTIAIGRPVRLTSLHLRPAGSVDDLGREFGELRLDILQAETFGSASFSDRIASLLNYSAPTLVMGNDPNVPLDRLIPAWFKTWEANRNLIGLLLGRYYAPFMYTAHRYSSAFQAVEALHGRPAFSGRELDRSAHSDRVSAVVRATAAHGLDPDTIGWVQRVLQSRNDKPLWRKVEDVTRSLGQAGEAILRTVPSFSMVAAALRAEVSHPTSDAANRRRMHWYGEVLHWIARGRLLASAGVPEIGQRIHDRAAFRHAVAQLRSATDQQEP